MISSYLYNSEIQKLFKEFLVLNDLYSKVSNNTLILKGRLQRIFVNHQRSNDTLTNAISVTGGIIAIIGGFNCSTQCEVAKSIVRDGNKVLEATTKVQQATQRTASSFSSIVRQNSAKIMTTLAVLSLGISEIMGAISKIKQIENLKNVLDTLDSELQKHVQFFQKFCDQVDALKTWKITKENILQKQNQVLIYWTG